MRYRALSPTGDMTFGQGGSNYLQNTPATVAQAVMTRLKLIKGEWFLDTTDGTPYPTEVLGYGTKKLYDTAIRKRILGTQGVTSIVAYSSSVTGRALSITATINTTYGQTTIEAAL